MRLRTSIRVLVVDDQRIIRQGIRHLLMGRTGVEIVGEADSGESAVRMSRRLRPGVVLMDLVMPGMGGVETIRRIVGLGQDIGVLVLTSFASDFDVRPALEAGAIGILSKDAEPEALLRAIKDVWRLQRRPQDEDSDGVEHTQHGVLAGP